MTDKRIFEGRAIANVSIERVSHTTTLYCSHPDVKAGFRLESGSKVSLFRTDPILHKYRCYFIVESQPSDGTFSLSPTKSTPWDVDTGTWRVEEYVKEA